MIALGGAAIAETRNRVELTAGACRGKKRTGAARKKITTVNRQQICAE
jgi:hypothetical protein